MGSQKKNKALFLPNPGIKLRNCRQTPPLSPLQPHYSFLMRGLREHIHQADFGQPIASLGKSGQITGQGGGVAGNVDDLPGRKAGQQGDEFGTTGTGRVE